MEIKTGKGYITFWALMGIWSVSALTSLPGLAISPILGDLTSIFKHATELDIQMLTTLPSLFIIPFILLAGRLSSAIGYERLLYLGLGVYLLCGVLYFFCGTIEELILVSVMLGIGVGIITPLSTSLISRFFTGEYRTRQFGYSSAINNLALVVATALTGYLAEVEWRLPFVVYLLPFFSLLLVWRIKTADRTTAVADENSVVQGGINYASLSRYMLYYLFVTYLVMVVSVNLPFLMEQEGYDSGTSGLVISLFFLSIMLPGFFLNKIVSFMGEGVFRVSLLFIFIGLFFVCFNKGISGVVIGVVLSGFGYGVAQPCLYDRVSAVSSGEKQAYALALLMSMNYVAIVICPYILDFVQFITGIKSNEFPFVFNACVGLLAFMVLWVNRYFRK